MNNMVNVPKVEAEGYLTVAKASEMLYKLYSEVINRLPEGKILEDGICYGSKMDSVCLDLNHIEKEVCEQYGITDKYQKWAYSHGIFGLTVEFNEYDAIHAIYWAPNLHVTKGDLLGRLVMKPLCKFLGGQAFDISLVSKLRILEGLSEDNMDEWYNEKEPILFADAEFIFQNVRNIYEKYLKD